MKEIRREVLAMPTSTKLFHTLNQSKETETLPSSSSSNQFLWREPSGQYISPKQMNTRHLFSTLVAIWNYVSPVEHQIEPFLSINFKDHYTPLYLKKAIHAIHAELNLRPNLPPYYQKCLAHIHSCFQKVLLK